MSNPSENFSWSDKTDANQVCCTIVILCTLIMGGFFGLTILFAYVLIGQYKKGAVIWLFSVVVAIVGMVTTVIGIGAIVHLLNFVHFLLCVWDVCILSGRLESKIPIGSGEFGNPVSLFVTGMFVGTFVRPCFFAGQPESCPLQWTQRMKELNIPIVEGSMV